MSGKIRQQFGCRRSTFGGWLVVVEKSQRQAALVLTAICCLAAICKEQTSSCVRTRGQRGIDELKECIDDVAGMELVVSADKRSNNCVVANDLDTKEAKDQRGKSGDQLVVAGTEKENKRNCKCVMTIKNLDAKEAKQMMSVATEVGGASQSKAGQATTEIGGASRHRKE